MRILKYQVNGWDSYLHVAEAKQKTILFRYAIKAPCVVLGVPRQVADFFHPLSAPRSGIEEGHYAKGPVRCILQPLQMLRPGDHHGQIALICVQQKINLWNQIFLQAVGDTPVYKVGPFILCLRAFRAVLQTEVRHFTGALALLDLPPCHVAIDEQVPLLSKKGCARANDEHSAQCLPQAASLFRELALIQEFREFVLAHEGKHWIIAQITRAEGLNGALGQVTFFSAQHDLRLQRAHQLSFNLLFKAAGIALHTNHETPGPDAGFQTLADRIPTRFAAIPRVRHAHQGILIVIRDVRVRHSSSDARLAWRYGSDGRVSLP